MAISLIQVDAFASKAFAGNPAAVCLLPEAKDAHWMQQVALEMNLSETAFVVPGKERAGHDGGFDLRWFTPAVEVDLCGHATLASAHALWQLGRLPMNEMARFHTKSGVLTAERQDDWIELNFPSTPEQAAEAPAGLAAALGAEIRYCGKSRFDYLVEVASEAIVRQLAPDMAALKKVPGRGIIVTSRASTPGLDFVSRFFAPAAGIDEDPVTGSAHCCLTPFWSHRLHKSVLTARQLSARGGDLRLRQDGERVRLAGQAVTVLRGELLA